MSDNTKTNLPINPADFASKMIAGLTKSRQTMAGGFGGGDDILRMQKDGVWVMGPSSEEIQDGSRWLLNTVSFKHGWVCWQDGANGGKAQKREVMGSAFEDAPVQPEPWNGKDYSKQHSFQLKCMDGEDAGHQVIHITSSIGGGKPIDALKDALIAQAHTDPVHAFPIIVFGSDHYPHSQYGRIYTPIYSIVGWADMEGNTDAGPAIAAPAKKGGKKPPLATAQKEPSEPPFAAPPPGPTPTQRAHSGQRRRPGA